MGSTNNNNIFIEPYCAVQGAFQDLLKTRQNLFLELMEGMWGEQILTMAGYDKDFVKITNKAALTESGGFSKYNIDQTIAALYTGGDGDFMLPDEAVQYIHSMDEEKFIHEGNIPFVESKLDKGVKFLETLVDDCDYNFYVACSLCGAFFVECGWDVHRYNQSEHSGGGTAGTEGWAGCGEGLFGLTFWTQKQRYITHPKLRHLMAGIGTSEAAYNAGKRHLCDLDEAAWFEIFKVYVESSPHKKYMFGEDVDDAVESKDEKFLLEILASSYLFKAGGSPGWENGIKRSSVYRSTHTKKAGGNSASVIDGFATQMLIAYMVYNHYKYKVKKEGSPIKNLKELMHSIDNQ